MHEALNLSADDGHIWVETRREGMLAPIGHDLRLEARRFKLSLSLDAGELSLSLSAADIVVRSAINGAVERPKALNRLERVKIERKIAGDVLDAQRYPKITFTGTTITPCDEGLKTKGRLTLRGVTRPLSALIVDTGESLEARITLKLSDYGISPITAFMGALRVNDEVSVIVALRHPSAP